MITPAIGDVVDFQLVQAGIYGDRRTEVTVTGVFDYGTAKLIDSQLNNKHVALYPYFKDKVQSVDDPTIYQYMTVQNHNGTIEVIGLPWVLDATYSPIKTRVATYSIQNFREDFRAPLQTFLNNLGAVYTVVTKTN